MKKVLLSALKVVGVWGFWLLLWFLVAQAIGIELLLPTPTRTLSVLWELLLTPIFWEHLVSSLLRVLLGILISFALGSLLAVLTSAVPLLRALLTPMINMIKSVPVSSFIILACLWLNTAALPILITSLIVIPIVWSNVCEGIAATDRELKEVCTVFRFSPMQKLTKLYIPSVFSYFLAACRSAIGMAWKAGIAAEVLAPPLIGVGQAMYTARNNLEAAPLFAWTLVVVLVSFVTEKLLLRLLDWIANIFHWTSGGNKHANA